jgi:hypothetical protein
MAHASVATVVTLQSHPAWVAAQQRARERSEAMRRHPSFRARKIAAAEGGEVGRGTPTGHFDQGPRRAELLVPAP